MQDRFKFRVWYMPEYDKPKMLYEAEKTYDYMYGESENINANCFGDLLEDKSYIVMQCTGLKDKNGKLIYEGDIIKICCCNLRKVQISDVFFCSERSAFCFHYKTDYGDYANCTMEKTEIEVIGNIYENPELLKECEDE